MVCRYSGCEVFDNNMCLGCGGFEEDIEKTKKTCPDYKKRLQKINYIKKLKNKYGEMK